MSLKVTVTLFIALLLLSCQSGIQSGNSLSASDIKYIQQLGLLDSGETIIKFASQLNNEVSGNFYTNRRIATYWMDERDSTKNHKAFAFYKDIEAIDTIFLHTSLTYASYLNVTRKDSSKFKVYVDDKEAAIRSFFEDVLLRWNIETLRRLNQR